MARTKSDNVQINISIPTRWKTELENPARIYSAEEGYYRKIYYHIKALVVMPDHIHIFVDVPQTVATCDIAGTFKDISAIELFKAFPQLIQFYAGSDILWFRGYFVSTEIKYIKEQKNDN